MTKKLSLFLTLGLAVATPALFANTLSPGGTVPPDALTVDPASTLVASSSGTLNAPGSFTATYTENIYSDPSNSYCAGCLDWVIEVSNSSSSSDSIERITASSFKGFSTDVGTNAAGAPGLSAPGSGNSPDDVTRSLNGAVIGFNFNGANAIAPGSNSMLLEIETNAQGVIPGTLSAIDSLTGSATAYGATTPEPVTMGLLGGGLALLGLARLRSKKNKA